ncbi:MAG: chorismate dehydratase, partial [Limisphaerales bacterium]
MSQVESKNAFPHKSPKNGLKNSPKIGLTAVSYHNTRPFLLGLQNHPISDQLDIQLDIPSAGGRKLASGVVSLGLVPVAVLNQLPNSRIITDWCIGADGPVKTVCLYGHQPIEKMDRIMLDYHSMTSVQLCKILVK